MDYAVATTLNQQFNISIGAAAHFTRPNSYMHIPVAGDVIMQDCFDSSGVLLAQAGEILDEIQVEKLYKCKEMPPVLSSAGLDRASASALALYGSGHSH